MTNGTPLFAGSTASAACRWAEHISEPIYHVTIIPTGEKFACPANQCILTAAHAADILISYSCRGGQCGACMGKLQQGKIAYPKGQPDAISEAQTEQGYALFCSAFALSDLTIELIDPAHLDY